MDTVSRRGRLSVRMTPAFLEACAAEAERRGLTLTDFVQQSMAANLARTPTRFDDTEQDDHKHG